MATAGMRLVHGLEPADLADDLDRLYCYEQVSIHWARAVDSPKATHSDWRPGSHSSGAAITPDPTQFLERSQLTTVQMPDDTSDPNAVLRYALAQEQRAIDS